jgi:hypothetical protein
MDSVVLALEYAGYYGDLSPQTFEVYELNEDGSVNRNVPYQELKN